MKWVRKLWRKEKASAGLFTADEAIKKAYEDNRVTVRVEPISDKQLDEILAAVPITRREIYDKWLEVEKVNQYPNDPAEVLAFAKAAGLL